MIILKVKSMDEADEEGFKSTFIQKMFKLICEILLNWVHLD